MGVFGFVFEIWVEDWCVWVYGFKWIDKDWKFFVFYFDQLDCVVGDVVVFGYNEGDFLVLVEYFVVGQNYLDVIG